MVRRILVVPFNNQKRDQEYLESALSAAEISKPHENLHEALKKLVLYAVRYDKMNVLTKYVQKRRAIDAGITTVSVEKWLTETLHLHINEDGEVSKIDNMKYGGRWAAKPRDRMNAWYIIARNMQKTESGMDWTIPDVNFAWLAKILMQRMSSEMGTANGAQLANNQSLCPICQSKLSVYLPNEIRFECPVCKTPLFVIDAGRGYITFSTTGDVGSISSEEVEYSGIKASEEGKSIIREILKENYRISPESRQYPFYLAGLWRMAIRATMSEFEEQASCARLVINVIDEEWLNIKRQQEIDQDYFVWPSTDIRIGDGTLWSNKWLETGVLSFLGYHVGKTQGLDDALRALILERIFNGVMLQVFPAGYLNKWGDPGSAKRLKSVAYTITAFVRNAKRKRSMSLDEAIRDWENDLEYLKRNFYINKFRFDWPTT